MRKTQEIEFQKKRSITITKDQIIGQSYLAKYKNRRLSPNIIRELLFLKLGDLKDKRILEIGCGDGEITVLCAFLGAEIDALDLSPDLISIAKKRAKINDVEKKINFLQADLEKINFATDKYDFIISYGVLHHTHFKIYFKKLINSLKKNGQMIMIEPINLSLGFNRFLDKIFRSKKRETSPGEKPLDRNDLMYISSEIKIIFQQNFHLFARLTRLLKGDNLPETFKSVKKHIIRSLYWIDSQIYRISPLRKHFRVVFLVGQNER